MVSDSTVSDSPIQIIQDFPTGVQLSGVVGIQGGHGSFNEQAIRHLLKAQQNTACTIEYLYTSDAVAKALVEGNVAFGQCAISNSLGGEVQETLDILEQYPISVVASFEIKIAHALMLRPDQSLDQITTIMCHPQVFAQCKGHLDKKYSHLAQVSGQGDLLDSARVAQAISERQLPDDVAVMGSRLFAELYNLNVVEDNLQDLSENFTRFIVLKAT